MQAPPANLIESIATNWSCPNCGRTAKITNPARQIRCACGMVVQDGQIVSTAMPDNYPDLRRRLDICEACSHWMGDSRCKQIEMGCRRTFLGALHSPHPKCPEDKWPAIGQVGQMSRFRMWPGVQRLNLLYHVCPLKSNDVWRANVRQVVRRLRIFNGRKVIAIATGNRLHGIDVVRKAFDDPAIEYLEIPNDCELREVATFLPLLEAVKSDDPEEASFYGHTKGNSTRDNALGAEMWRNAMYHHLLDHVNVCRDLLLKHPCVGTHKMHFGDATPPYPSGLRHGAWLFAGTFFWIRHDAVFSHPRWRDVPRDRYGAEAWLSGLFEPDAAATVFQPWPANEYPTPSPYDPALYTWPIRDV